MSEVRVVTAASTAQPISPGAFGVLLLVLVGLGVWTYWKRKHP
jgi:hypothetical protein